MQNIANIMCEIKCCFCARRYIPAQTSFDNFRSENLSAQQMEMHMLDYLPTMRTLVHDKPVSFTQVHRLRHLFRNQKHFAQECTVICYAFPEMYDVSYGNDQ